MIQTVITIQEVIKNEHIRTLFQPIVSLINGEILGYEALSRGPENTPFFSPITLIEAAEEENCIWDLEMLFRKKAIEKSFYLASNQLLFLNVDPNIISDSNYKTGFTIAYLDRYNIDPTNIVFEITERTAIQDYHTFSNIVDHYKQQSYNIAIDDAGSGYSGLKSIIEFKPDYVKIDMDLIRDIDTDTFKSSIIKGLVSVARDTGLKLIAEGVETHAELKALIALGVHYAQGYLLQRPMENMITDGSNIRNLILRTKRETITAFSYDTAYFVIGKITTAHRCLKESATCGEAKEIFNASQCDSLSICDASGFPMGLMMRSKFHGKLADRYGYDLYYQRPLSLLMNPKPLIIDYYTPVNQVLSLAMQRSKDELYDDLIVTKNGKCHGLVSVYEIIRHTTEYEKMYAKQLNPLTLMPGNAIIRQVLDQHLVSGETTGLLYIDLDHFKSYNDVYGFEEGDLILKRTGQLIEQIIAKDNDRNFIGHIGGDDFVAIVRGEKSRIKNLCEDLCISFRDMITDFFTEEDSSRGYYIGKDRYGEIKQFPLTSITIAGLYGVLSPLETVERIGQYMGDIKRLAKATTGDCYKIHDLNSDCKM